MRGRPDRAPEGHRDSVAADAVVAEGPYSLADTMEMESGGSLSQRPEAPLRIEGACPFECCTYGTWTTTGPTTVYERPERAAASWTVPGGTSLEAPSGFVLLTEVGVAVARGAVRIHDEEGSARLATVGDTLFVLDNIGEGFRRVWHAGGIFQSDAVSGIHTGAASTVDVLREPQEQWWAQVRSPNGREGWLWMDRTPPVRGADACS